MLDINAKSTFCQKVTVHKDRKSPFISNLQKPAYASKRDVLELVTLRYMFLQRCLFINGVLLFLYFLKLYLIIVLILCFNWRNFGRNQRFEIIDKEHLHPANMAPNVAEKWTSPWLNTFLKSQCFIAYFHEFCIYDFFHNFFVCFPTRQKFLFI